ncbi:MAG: hypothetical protein ACK5LK_05600 [Chthoniobacterales bacterium]
MPDRLPTDLDDSSTLRWSVRSDGEHGFLFINNYQRIEALSKKKDVQFALKLKNKTLVLPATPIDIPAQSYCFWPFNMNLNGALLVYATAQPLCRIGDIFVFFACDGIDAEFVFEKSAQPLKPKFEEIFNVGAKAKILLLSQKQARRTFKANIWGAERLFLSQSVLLFDGETLRLQSRKPENMDVRIYPAPPPLDCEPEHAGIFSNFSSKLKKREIAVSFERIRSAKPAAEIQLDKNKRAIVPGDSDFDEAEIWKIRVPADALEGAHEAFLRIHYTGDIARAYIDDRLVDDDFYFGRPWEIGLWRFVPEVFEKGITIKNFTFTSRRARLYSERTPAEI